MEDAEKLIIQRNFSKVLQKKVAVYNNTIERQKKIISRLKDQNRYLRKKVKKYEESNISRKD